MLLLRTMVRTTLAMLALSSASALAQNEAAELARLTVHLLEPFDGQVFLDGQRLLDGDGNPLTTPCTVAGLPTDGETLTIAKPQARDLSVAVNTLSDGEALRFGDWQPGLSDVLGSSKTLRLPTTPGAASPDVGGRTPATTEPLPATPIEPAIGNLQGDVVPLRDGLQERRYTFNRADEAGDFLPLTPMSTLGTVQGALQVDGKAFAAAELRDAVVLEEVVVTGRVHRGDHLMLAIWNPGRDNGAGSWKRENGFVGIWRTGAIVTLIDGNAGTQTLPTDHANRDPVGSFVTTLTVDRSGAVPSITWRINNLQAATVDVPSLGEGRVRVAVGTVDGTVLLDEVVLITRP